MCSSLFQQITEIYIYAIEIVFSDLLENFIHFISNLLHSTRYFVCRFHVILKPAYNILIIRRPRRGMVKVIYIKTWTFCGTQFSNMRCAWCLSCCGYAYCESLKNVETIKTWTKMKLFEILCAVRSLKNCAQCNSDNWNPYTNAVNLMIGINVRFLFGFWVTGGWRVRIA